MTTTSTWSIPLAHWGSASGTSTCSAPPRYIGSAAEHSRFGYDAVKQLMAASGSPPDGLFVYPDSAVAGVVMNLMAHGLHRPDQLKLVVHRNKNVDLMCPLPSSFVELDTDKAADALVHQVEQLHLGQARKIVTLEHVLVPLESSNLGD